MNTDLVEAREEKTERRPLHASGSASHPALANSLARLARLDKRQEQPLRRIPRASVAPAPEAKTQLSPRPLFDDEVELLEDSGLLVLDPGENIELVEELSSRFLIDEDSRQVLQTESLPVLSSHELDRDELDELDSGHLAYVEAKGEIERPKVRLATLHEQALAEGIAQYSDGVPTHTLARTSQISGTLRVRVRREAVATSVWRHLPVVLVFAAGIGAGVFFAIRGADSSSTQAQPAPAPIASAQGLAPELEAPIPVVVPLQTAPENVVAASAVDEEIKVAPLPEQLAHDEELPAPAETTPSSEPSETKRSSRRATSAKQATVGSADPGVLMLAAKPPCSIRINGKDTGLVTPQRVLKLPPGKHKVVLVNQEHGLRDSFVVSIRSGEKTKIIRDITSKIR